MSLIEDCAPVKCCYKTQKTFTLMCTWFIEVVVCLRSTINDDWGGARLVLDLLNTSNQKNNSSNKLPRPHKLQLLYKMQFLHPCSFLYVIGILLLCFILACSMCTINLKGA